LTLPGPEFEGNEILQNFQELSLQSPVLKLEIKKYDAFFSENLLYMKSNLFLEVLDIFVVTL